MEKMYWCKMYNSSTDELTLKQPASFRIRLYFRQMNKFYAVVLRKNSERRFIYDFVKRTMDIFLSLLALFVLLPLFLIVAVSIKLEDRGPVFFSQKRWGLGQKEVNIFKFRSMYIDRCDTSGIAQTVKNDSRVTKVGAFIRRTNIDELPQLLNILRGEMSIVGPRCHPIGMFAAGLLYEDLIKSYHKRHAVKPGLTGLAQVRGFRGPTVDVESAKGRILNDLVYIKNRSLVLDVWIIAATFLGELKGGKGF